MAKVEFQGVRKSFGAQLILPELSLSVESGEFLAVVGPSGCGKSTLLRLVAGLENPERGSILIDGKNVNDVSPAQRGVSMVFQSYALYPHMSVRDNLAFPLKMIKMPSNQIDKRIDETAAMLDLTSLLSRKPSQLSGGQKQRVAMGRAMVKRPKVLLFDEPLSNLDAQLRIKVRAEIAMLHKQIKSTVIYVTHDQIEAMTLADKIAVLDRGRLEQMDAPLKIYEKPLSRFVASFIGTPSMNLVSRDDLASNADIHLPQTARTVGFRPEALSLAPTQDSTVKLPKARVQLIEPLGSATHVHLSLGKSSILMVLKPGAFPAVASDVDLYLNPKAFFYYDQQDRLL